MIDPAAILAHRFEDQTVQVAERDAILYALGIGLGDDPVAPEHLRYTYEDGLRVFPTMPVALGSPGMWFGAPGLGIDPIRLVHAEQALRNNRPLVVGERLTARNRVAELVDKGAGRGALLVVERILDDAAGATVAQVRSSYLLRGEGGFGGNTGDAAPPTPMPHRAADVQRDVPTSNQAALLYRLSGDRNKLHVDPAFARRAGLDRPILHGLCTFAIAARGVLDAFGGALEGLGARMSAPVIPGDMIRVLAWQEPDGIRFAATVPARGATVLSHGHAALSMEVMDA